MIARPGGDADAAATNRADGDRLGNFYGDVLDATALARAALVEGVDDDLAALRVRLKELMKERPEDYALALKSMDTLVRMVMTRYRISEQRGDDLARHVAAVLKDLHVQLFPELAEDV
jgi:hypothetical protein